MIHFLYYLACITAPISKTQDGAKSSVTTIIAAVTGSAVVLIVAVLLTVIVCKRKQRSTRSQLSSTKPTTQLTENAAYGMASLQPTAPSDVVIAMTENSAYGMGVENEPEYSYVINPMRGR